ncbi:MAG: hypothetical protein ACYTGN_05875 [Planctomycetota bacterium]|jgi:hypothetical protein
MIRGLIFLLVLGVGCHTVDPAYQARDGRDVRDLDPLPYKIAIGQIGEYPRSGEADDDGYWFVLDNEEVQDLLVAVADFEEAAAEERKLLSQRAANEVIQIDSESIDDLLNRAQALNVDLLLLPRVAEPPDLQYKGAKRTTSSVMLWLFTWIGGRYVDDKSYLARMSIDFEVVNPYDGSTIDSFTVASETIDLSLGERDDGWSGGTAQSVIIPPQLTVENKERTSRVLSRLICSRLAARVSGYLKEDFVGKERALLGTLRVQKPRNRSEVGEKLEFQAELVADEPITDCTVFANGREILRLTDNGAKGARLPAAADQSRGKLFSVSFAAPPVDAVAGRNVVRVEYAVQGRYSSRTLLYFRKDPKEKAS